MLKSMTAYGRASVSTSLGHFVVEVQSLNRKFLEITVILPKELVFLETEIRKWIAAGVARGKLQVRLTATYENKIPLAVVPNLPLARQLKAAWESIAKELQLPGSQAVTLDILKHEPAILSYSEEFDALDSFIEPVQRVITEALGMLNAMKAKEGEAIANDLFTRLKSIKEWIGEIQNLSKNSTNRYREKLRVALEEALPGSVENDERLLREVCVYAEKVDISEELTRLHSHHKQFTDILHEERQDKGKVLEFILQEMHREINTIGAKSDDIKITKLVIAVKTEVEKIREQIQNVE